MAEDHNKNKNDVIMLSLAGAIILAIGLIVWPFMDFSQPVNKPDKPDKSVEQPDPPPEPPADSAGDTESAVIMAVLSAHNKERVKLNVAPLRLNDKLTSAAKKHATWMAQAKNMSHTGKNNSSVGDRVKAEGYSYKTAGENIAFGYKSVSSVMAGWMNSAGHKANILNKNYLDAGMAYATDSKGAVYWCVNFGSSFSFQKADNSATVEALSIPPAIFADLNETFNGAEISAE